MNGYVIYNPKIINVIIESLSSHDFTYDYNNDYERDDDKTVLPEFRVCVPRFDGVR